jgi:transmembrane sensor
MDQPDNIERYEYLASKWRDKTITTAEERELFDWLNAFDNDDLNVPASFFESEEELKSEIYRHIGGKLGLVGQPKKVRLWPRIAVAAAAVAAIVVGVWFFNYRGEIASVPRNDAAQNDIAPGKNGATITLANGNVIQLSDKKLGVVVGKDLKYNDGAAVQGGGPNLYRSSTARADDVMQLTASTAKGQTYQFTLPDGTKVWLNTDSKISFPSQFLGKERKILLEGEGYFEVVHNAKQPFKVESKGQIVEDIGTEFNINAYADEAVVKTTLVEGEARVMSLRDEVAASRRAPRNDEQGGEAVVLKPNQQSILLRRVREGLGLTGSNRIAVKQVNPEESVAWKDGVFMYNSTPLENVMRQIARWYNVEVEYADAGAKSRMLGGTALRSGNLSVILKTLESTGAVKFKVEGRKIIVK